MFVNTRGKMNLSCTNCAEIDARLVKMRAWLSSFFPSQDIVVSPVAGDASFRRYFRATVNQQAIRKTFIVMDAPPEKEQCDAFIAIAMAFKNSSARFPEIIASDLAQGFLLLSDFGDQQLLPLLNPQSADQLYRTAINELIVMQQCKSVPNYELPHFDNALFWREFEILETWYIKKNLKKTVSDADEKELKGLYQLLIDSAHAQSQVFVHRDYHARNIMLCEDKQLGILDFQDAVMGPITYDLVSLLRDCYIAWPQVETESWVAYFYKQANVSVDFETFLRWFDWMGLQRHLKCLGIFSRLYFRDGKEGYLKEIPRVLNYVEKVCDRYPELQALKRFVK